MKLRFLFCLPLFFLVASCDRSPSKSEQVILYTAVDEPPAWQVVGEFKRQTGIEVIMRTDAESTKTAGLAERLEAEKGNPQADVWWSNEPFHTINLAEHNVLAPYASPAAASIPDAFKDKNHVWAGTSIRVRVLAVNNKCPISPRSIFDLTNPALKGKICISRPIAGTAKGHMAVLYTTLGREKFEKYLNDLKDNQVRLVGGNSIVAELVGSGQMLAGLTDNDDVEAAAHEGGKLELVLPDQGENEMGALAVPCTAALVAGAAHDANAKKLIDFLLSQTVEYVLIDRHFAKYSVINPPANVKFMKVDYAQAAANMKDAVELALKILEGR